MIERLYKANIIAASIYGLVSLFACSAFQLWHPHPVGHIAPAVSAGIACAWSVHCILLGTATNTRPLSTLLRNSAFPFVISVVAIATCFGRYASQLAA